MLRRIDVNSKKNRIKILCVILALLLFAGNVPVFAAQKWTAPIKSQWSLSRAPYSNSRSPVNVSWNAYLAKYYPSAAYCVIPPSVKKLNLYVQIYGKDAAKGNYQCLKTCHISKWNATLDSSSRLKFRSGHTYRFRIRLAQKKNGSYKAVTGFSDVKSVKMLYYPAKLTVKQTSGSTLRLEWSAVTAAQGYYIYIETTDGKTTQKKVVTKKGKNSCSYTLNNVKQGKHYSFGVAAYIGELQSAKQTAHITVK